MANENFTPKIRIANAARDEPVEPGSLIAVPDAGDLYVDSGDSRWKLGDVVNVNTEAARIALLAPLHKLHYVTASGRLRMWDGEKWVDINRDVLLRQLPLSPAWHKNGLTTGRLDENCPICRVSAPLHGVTKLGAKLSTIAPGSLIVDLAGTKHVFNVTERPGLFTFELDWIEGMNTDVNLQRTGGSAGAVTVHEVAAIASTSGSVKVKIGPQITGYYVDALDAGANPTEVDKYINLKNEKSKK